MIEFNGMDMLQIDIANAYGLDKATWAERLLWFQYHRNKLETLVDQADDKYKYIKAIKAYQDTLLGKPSGHVMFLDATASGLQIMACLSGCMKTAANVNLIKTGNREDAYLKVSSIMNALLPPEQATDRDLIKNPLMTHYYNKVVQDTLTDDQGKAFYNVLGNNFEGAEMVKDLINSYWDCEALEHTWTLPDGHVAKVLVTEPVTARVEVDELDHSTFSYRFTSNQPSNTGTSLCPNIIQSIDGYIVREMIRKANDAGFELAHVFDAFAGHPNHMKKIMQFYREVLADIADSNLLADILSEISGTKVEVPKLSSTLSNEVLQSEYALS